jgi:hypothetical protein
MLNLVEYVSCYISEACFEKAVMAKKPGKAFTFQVI